MRDNKTRGQRRTVALAVLFGAIEGLAEFSGIEGVKRRGDVRTIPGFRSDGPDDRVLVAIGRNGGVAPEVMNLVVDELFGTSFPLLIA